MDSFYKPLRSDVYKDFIDRVTDSHSTLYHSNPYGSVTTRMTKNHLSGGILRGRHAGLHIYRDEFRPYINSFKLVYAHRFTLERLEEIVDIARRAKRKLVIIDEDNLTKKGRWDDFYVLEVEAKCLQR